jgi:hypothetical protein
MAVGGRLQEDCESNQGDFNTSTPYNDGGQEVLDYLLAYPPISWYWIAMIGLLVVWTSITMALLLAYNTPTIGLGCWSGSFLLFGALSSVTWMLQFIRPQRPPEMVRKICTFINLISLGWLITVVFLMVSPEFPNGSYFSPSPRLLVLRIPVGATRCICSQDLVTMLISSLLASIDDIVT